MNVCEKGEVRGGTGSSSSSSSFLTRFKSEEVLKAQNNLSLMDERIEKQLLKEIELTKEILEGYQTKLRTGNKQKGENCLNTLITMEQMISRRDSQIAQLNKQIKQLKSAPHEIKEETNKQYVAYESGKLFKLAHQIRNSRQQLLALQTLHSRKCSELAKKKQISKDLEQKYLEVCSKFARKPISFQEFKDEKRFKKKQGQMRLKKSMKKIHHHPSIKEVIIQEPNSSVSMTLKEVLSKKEITESALKVAKKKHINEMVELNAKLEFLKDENELLEGKLKEKDEEFKAADTRFSERRSGKLKRKFIIHQPV